ncbi:MAG TPA: hypothetical protein VFF26_13585 [Gallionella sp.]|nr:hypothetical protein [Gallionella sp.]
MAISPVISGLVTKRSELGRLLAERQEEVQQLQAAVDSLDNAIKLFDPDFDLRRIKAKARYTVNPWFEHGEIGRLVLETLRKSGEPLSTRQLGELIVAERKLRIDGPKEWDWMLKMVHGAAQRLERKKLIKMLGRVKCVGNGPMIWQIA